VPGADIEVSDIIPGVRGRILELSGAKALIEIYHGGDRRTLLAVIDQNQKTLTHISSDIETSPLYAHLAPGGMYVVVEEVSPDNARKRTGKLVMYDSARGTLVRTIKAPGIASMYFQALTPSGQAVYGFVNRFRFLKLRKEFGVESVTRVVRYGIPDYPTPFFSQTDNYR